MTKPWRKDIKDAMWSMFWLTKDKQKADLQQLKEDIETLIQMTTQKTASQRKNKDISWDNLERVQMNIICGAAALYLTGWLDEKDAVIEKYEKALAIAAEDFNRVTAKPHDAFDFRKHYTSVWKKEAGL